MFANNITNFILHLTNNGTTIPGKFDLSDEIIRSTMITQGSKIVHPAIQKLLNPLTGGLGETTGGNS
jgi:hypothetical protein